MMETETNKSKDDTLNYKPSTIYKDRVDVDDPEIMRKIRYGFPLNIVDVEFDVPDVQYEIKDCPLCNSKNSMKKTPIKERFVRGLLGNFLVNIDTGKRYYGRMIKLDKPTDMGVIYLCDNCRYAETKYDKFVPELDGGVDIE